MEAISKIVGLVVLSLLLIVGLGLLFALPTMWLWNGCLVGAVSFASPIGWLQAWGLNILAGLMFGSRSVSSN